MKNTIPDFTVAIKATGITFTTRRPANRKVCSLVTGLALTLGFSSQKTKRLLQPAMNLQIAQVYLQHGDPTMSRRTWQNVMERIISINGVPPRERWDYAIKDKGV